MRANQDPQMGCENRNCSMPTKRVIPLSGQMNDSDLHPSNSTGQVDLLELSLGGEVRVYLQPDRICRELLAMSCSTSVLRESLQDISEHRQGFRRANGKILDGQHAVRIPMRRAVRRVSRLRQFLVHKHAFLQDNYPSALVTTCCDWIMLGEWGIMRKIATKSKKV